MLQRTQGVGIAAAKTVHKLKRHEQPASVDFVEPFRRHEGVSCAWCEFSLLDGPNIHIIHLICFIIMALAWSCVNTRTNIKVQKVTQ